MKDTYEIRDPFTNEAVQVSNALTDRLRGRYAVGPTMPDGEPEFGWRTHETPPIQHEAAKEIAEQRAQIIRLSKLLKDASHALRSYQYGNSSTELAKTFADFIDTAITKATGESK